MNKKNKISNKILNKILKDSINFDNIITSFLLTKQWKDNTKIKTKTKKKRKNAYTVFSSKYRSIVKQENPDKKFGEISKIIGKKWKDLIQEEKLTYRNEALRLNQISKNQIDNEEENKLIVFTNNENSLENDNLHKENQKKLFQKHLTKLTQNIHNILFDIIISDISNKYNISQKELVKCIPFKNKKLKKNAYTIFSSSHRKKIKQLHPEKNFGEISKMVGLKWKQLTDEEKLVYKTKAEEENKILD
jgi:hypothetical protein